MSAFDCMLPDDAGIYCSSDITTGKWLYYELLKKHNVSSSEILIERIGDEAFKNARKPFLDSNIERGNEFAETLRERGLINVVTPGPYFAKGFDQQHYLYLWEWFIIKKIYEVRFNDDWEYSDGCTFEYAIAAKKGIPRFDIEGSSLDLEMAIEKVERAVNELRTGSFVTRKLEHNLGLLKTLRD